MAVTDITTLITTVGTFIAAIATCLTVLEMQKQRRIGQMPNLLIASQKDFYLFKSIRNPIPSFTHWHEIHDVELIQIENVRESFFNLNLINAGIGAAINIEFNYKFDKREIYKVLNDNNEFDSIEIIDNQDNVTFNASISGIDIGIWLGKIDLNFKELFIGHSLEKPYSLKLPMLYLSAFNAFCIKNFIKIPDEDFFLSFPKLIVEVTYSDIKYVSYRKKFEISIKVNGVALNTDRTTEKVSGRFIVKEI